MLIVKYFTVVIKALVLVLVRWFHGPFFESKDSLYVAVCAALASGRFLPSGTAHIAGGDGDGDGEICNSFLMMTSFCKLSIAAAAAVGVDAA